MATQVVINLRHVFAKGSSPRDNALALEVLLKCLVDLNLAYLRWHAGELPELYSSGVRYGRTVEWEPIPELYARGYGDCKSLSAALIAEYTMNGMPAKPVFRFVSRPDGEQDFHILVQTPHGFEDPSKILGMEQNENAYFNRAPRRG